MEKGDRVKHYYLGKGTFIKTISFMSLVKWDKTPDFRYNFGQNPTIVFTDKLKLIPKENER